MTYTSQKTLEGRIADLERKDRNRRNFVGWIGCAVIIVLFIVCALNVHYIRATESTFSKLQEAINTVSAALEEEGTGSAGNSRTITVEVDHANLLSADYLAGVIPVIIGLAGALVVFLGMERLQTFDGRIDSVNSEIRKELEAFNDKIDQRRVETKEELEKEIDGLVEASLEKWKDSQKTEIADRVKWSVEHEFSQEREKWDRRERKVTLAQEQFQEALSKHKAELSDELDEAALAHLQELEAKAKAYIDGLNNYTWLKAIIQEGETKISVPTVEDAHRLTERLRMQKPDGHHNMIRQVVEKVCSENLSGDQADYHNLSAELARGSMYNRPVRKP